MGLDQHIKKRQIKEYDIAQKELEKLNKKLDKNTILFIESYDVEVLEELKEYSLKEILYYISIIEENEKHSEDYLEKRDEKIMKYFDIYYLFDLFTDEEDENHIRIHSFFNTFKDKLEVFNSKIYEEISIIETNVYHELNKEIFYRGKDPKFRKFLTELAIEKGIIKSELNSFVEIPFNKEDYVKLNEEFEVSDFEENLKEFDNDNILIYAFIWF